MSAKKYFGAFCLYLNYLVHGIGVLVMASTFTNSKCSGRPMLQAYPS